MRYGITDKVALGIIYSVNKLRSYFLGRKFIIHTEHSALKLLNTGEPQTDRLKRWAAIPVEFDYEIYYIKGTDHADIDCLSRAPIGPPDR